MKIQEALKKAKKKGRYLRSKSLDMEQQDIESLAYWVFADRHTNDIQKCEQFIKILLATDWELDDEV